MSSHSSSATAPAGLKRVVAAFALYTVGFLARPLGGLVFGHYGDKFGRKRLLQLSSMSSTAQRRLPGTWWAPR